MISQSNVMCTAHIHFHILYDKLFAFAYFYGHKSNLEYL